MQIVVNDPDTGGQTQIAGPMRYTGLSNLAFNKVVTADRGWGCCVNPARLVDGGIHDPIWMFGFAWAGGLARWDGGEPGWKQATIDLGAVQTVARVDWWPHQSTVVPLAWRIEASSDGVTYAELFSSTLAVCRADATPLNVSWATPRCAHRGLCAGQCALCALQLR
ncbi:MAG: hypothetical protein IPK16_30555 [Anaerolineales bacterium]|nr:hypothetical protein [Anaerolineales bacterium]